MNRQRRTDFSGIVGDRRPTDGRGRQRPVKEGRISQVLWGAMDTPKKLSTVAVNEGRISQVLWVGIAGLMETA